MRIGANLTGLSLLLILGLVTSVAAVRCLAICFARAPNTLGTWWAAVAGGYVVFLGFGLAIAELLGAIDSLTRWPLAVAWTAFSLLNISLSVVYRPPRRRGRPSRVRNVWLVAASVLTFSLLLLFIFWLGAVSAPNNLDAMNYHLPRVAEWATNQSVNNYPTNIGKQTYDGRLAEYFATQALVLDGTDRFVFLPQFLAYFVSTTMVAGLARQLGGGRRAALWGLLLAGTLPLALMQATTAQNDLFVASVVLAAYYLSVVLWQLRRLEVTVLLLVAAAFGLAIVTKADSVLALAPLAVALVVVGWRNRWAARAALRWGVVAIALCIAMTLPMTLRNWQVYANPGGPPTGLNVSSFAPTSLAVNATENALLNIDTLNPAQNRHIFNVESSLSRTFGWNRPNPKLSISTTWPVLDVTPTEDGSGDLIAFLSVLIAPVLLLFGEVRRRVFQPGRYLLPTILSSTAGLVLIVTSLKWQLWGARFQLMALLPMLACVAVIFGSIRKRMVTIPLTSVFVVVSLILTPLALLKDFGKPVIGLPSSYLAWPRDTQMFRWCPALQPPYTAAVHDVAQNHQETLGYMSQPDDFEYPLWALLSQEARGNRVHIDPVFVRNNSMYLVGNQVRPRVVLVSRATTAQVEAAATPLVRSGYRRQSVTDGGCTTVGIYTLPKA